MIPHGRQLFGEIYKELITLTTITSQITSLMVVYSAVYSGADQRKHQSSASLGLVRGIHRGPVNSSHKWPVTRKMFPFDDVIMQTIPRGRQHSGEIYRNLKILIHTNESTDITHCNDLAWALWRLKLLAFRLFVKHLVRVKNKGLVTAPHYGPFVSKFLGCRWIPSQESWEAFPCHYVTM